MAWLCACDRSETTEMGCLATRYKPSPTVPTQILSCMSCIRQEMYPSDSDGLAWTRPHWPSASEKYRPPERVPIHIRRVRSCKRAVTRERVEPRSKGVGAKGPVQRPFLGIERAEC